MRRAGFCASLRTSTRRLCINPPRARITHHVRAHAVAPRGNAVDSPRILPLESSGLDEDTQGHAAAGMRKKAIGMRRRGNGAGTRATGNNAARGAERGAGQEPGDPRYSVGDLVSALSIPRSTLLYYETLGIVQPLHDEASGYRSYTNEDVYRLMNCVMLKNLGVSPKDIDDLLDSQPFSPHHLDDYLAITRRRIAYHQAQAESLEALRFMAENVGKVWVEDVEPYYICFDTTETGFGSYPSNEVLDLLLENLPVSSLGARFQDDFFDITQRAQWGRTIAVRHARLVPELPEGLEVCGGCRCLCTIHCKDDAMRLSSDTSTSRWRMHTYLEEHGLRVAGNAFIPYLLFTGKGCCIKICLPVEEA